LSRGIRNLGILLAAGFLAAFVFSHLGPPDPARIHHLGPPDPPRIHGEDPSARSFRACIRSDIRFVPRPGTESVRIRMLAIPDRLDHQTLLSRTAIPLPTDSGTNSAGTWLEWRFVSPADSGSVSLVQCAERIRHDLSGVITLPGSLEDPSRYLASDSLHPLEDPAIANLAATLPEGTPQEVTLRIWEKVRGRLKYGGYDPVDRGASAALATGRGDCSEFSDLQASLMRKSGIPARTPRGWTRSGNTTESHQWVEGFLPGRGWTEFDPLWASLGHHGIDRVPGLRLELSHHPSPPALQGQSRATWIWTGEEPTFRWRDSLWAID